MKKDRTGRWIFGILLCVLMAGLLACQPTPEEEIVINRGDGVMEEKIFGDTAPSQQIEKRTHWTESLSLGAGLTLEIDCPVEWGEEDVYPVNQYMPAPFTAEKIVQLSHLFFGEITGLREQEVSYEELVNELLRLEKGMYEGLDEEGNPIWTPYSGEEKEEKAAEIRAQMAQVPAADTFIPFTADTLPLQKVGHTHLTLQQQDGTLGYGDVFLEEGHWSLYLSKEDGGILSYENNNDGTPALSQEEAQSRAEAFLTSVGAEHMGLASVVKGKFGAYGEVCSEGWLLTYVPVLAGTRSVSLLGYGRHEGFQDSFTEEYASRLESEELILYVTEKGVEYMRWSNPYTLLEVANENVALLSFEEVQDCVRTYMQLGFAQGVSDVDSIMVQRVVLTSTLVHVREDLETGYRVPVWAIFYLSDLDEKMGYPQSVLLINALDGSLVR